MRMLLEPWTERPHAAARPLGNEGSLSELLLGKGDGGAGLG